MALLHAMGRLGVRMVVCHLNMLPQEYPVLRRIPCLLRIVHFFSGSLVIHAFFMSEQVADSDDPVVTTASNNMDLAGIGIYLVDGVSRFNQAPNTLRPRLRISLGESFGEWPIMEPRTQRPFALAQRNLAGDRVQWSTMVNS